MSNLNANSARKKRLPHEKLILHILVAMFGLLPVYIFPSGGFNVADGPMLVIMGYILLTHCKSEMLMQIDTLIALLAFLLWAVWVNMITFLVSSPILCVIASLQMFYTVLMFITMTIMFYRTISDVNAVKYIYGAVLLCAVVPLMMNGLPTGFIAREGLSFPNPNQLAYFAQIIIAAVLVLNHNAGMFYADLKTDKWIRLSTILVIVLGHYYMLLSASRAGLTGVAFLDLIALWRKKKLFVTVFLFFVILILGTNYINTDQVAGMKIYKRMMAGTYYDGLAERTEGRFNFDDLSLIFGGGKANRSLDEKKVREFKEVHNTFGDVVYSYGMIGGAVFSFFILFYFRACFALKFNVFVLLSFLPLHITHNMIRFRLMWILYALIYSSCLLYRHSVELRAHSREIAQKQSLAGTYLNYAAPVSKKA